MPGHRKKYITLILCVVTSATLLISFVMDSLSNVAHAAGKPYRDYTWAGVRVSSIYWDVDQRGHVPDKVQAQWKIPCLPSVMDGVYGDFDMWIGMESADGKHLIQSGIRGWHRNLNGVAVNEYWAWAINTNNPNALYPYKRFTVDNCGSDITNATVYASVDTAGQVSITVTDPIRNHAEPPRNYSASLGYPMVSPRFADYVIERSSSAMPNFGTARFSQCRVFYNNGNNQGIPGNGDVTSYPFNMYTSNWYGSSYYVPKVAVQTYLPNMYGDFSLRRLLPY